MARKQKHTSPESLATTEVPMVFDPTAAAPVPYQLGTDPLAAAGELGLLDIGLLVESPNNPRREFDKAALDTLVESIRQHGILQPLVVRDTHDGRFEVVAGARRLRAAKALGLTMVPANVFSAITDEKAAEMQLVENMQRDDLSPIDEADGYRKLREMGLPPAQIAGRIGRSQSYIVARLKLLDLTPKARKLLAEGRLDVATALLVARIPDPKLADEAAKQIVTRGVNGEPLGYKAAAHMVEREFMLVLKGAPFDRKSEDLVPAAGACGPCPKRTGNDKDLFGDVAGGDDICTDPTCFKAKTDAAWKLRIVEAKEKGINVLDKQKAAERAVYQTHVDLSSKCHEDPKGRTYATILKGTDVEPVLVRDPRSGQPRVMVPREVASSVARKAAAPEKAAEAKEAKVEKQKREQEQAVEERTLRLVLGPLCAHAVHQGSYEGFLALMVRDAWEDQFQEDEAAAILVKAIGLEHAGGPEVALTDLLARLPYGADWDSKIEPSQQDVDCLMKLALCLHLSRHEVLSGFGSNTLALWCKRLGVDLKAFRKTAAAQVKLEAGAEEAVDVAGAKAKKAKGKKA